VEKEGFSKYVNEKLITVDCRRLHDLGAEAQLTVLFFGRELRKLLTHTDNSPVKAGW